MIVEDDLCIHGWNNIELAIREGRQLVDVFTREVFIQIVSNTDADGSADNDTPVHAE
jgi:hypothetical protein